MKYYGYVYVGQKKAAELKRCGTTLESLRIENHFAGLDPEEHAIEIIVENCTHKPESAHYEYLERLINGISNSSLVIVSLKDFSHDEEKTEKLYCMCWRNEIDLQILDTPWLNTSLMKKHRISQSGAAEMIDTMYKYDRYRSEEIAAAKAMLVERPCKPTVHNTNRGRKLETQKARDAKALMVKKSMYFEGTMSDAELIEELGFARNTYYKYKKELRKELLAARAAEEALDRMLNASDQ